jgi:hypothetical protein
LVDGVPSSKRCTLPSKAAITSAAPVNVAPSPEAVRCRPVEQRGHAGQIPGVEPVGVAEDEPRDRGVDGFHAPDDANRAESAGDLS